MTSSFLAALCEVGLVNVGVVVEVTDELLTSVAAVIDNGKTKRNVKIYLLIQQSTETNTKLFTIFIEYKILRQKYGEKLKFAAKILNFLKNMKKKFLKKFFLTKCHFNPIFSPRPGQGVLFSILSHQITAKMVRIFSICTLIEDIPSPEVIFFYQKFKIYRTETVSQLTVDRSGQLLSRGVWLQEMRLKKLRCESERRGEERE